MPAGGFHRAPPAKPSCKLSRAVVDSNKDGAKQVRPLLKPHRLGSSSWPSKAWLFGGFGAHRSLRERRAGDAPTDCARPHAPQPLSPPTTVPLPQSPPQPNLTMLWLPRRQLIKLLRSAPVNGTKPNEMRPLTYAVRLGRPRAVEALLKVRPPLAVHLS